MEATTLLSRRLSGAAASTSRAAAVATGWRTYTTAIHRGCQALPSASPPPAGERWRASGPSHARPPPLLTRHVAAAAAASNNNNNAAAADETATLKPALPSAEFSRVRKAAFVSCAVDLKGCPPERFPEFAVIGRSNVGKSSLINMLTSSGGMAKVSKEPGAFFLVGVGWRGFFVLRHRPPQKTPPTKKNKKGKTQTINHYLINDAWYLVDLPGYGYAKAARGARLSWIGFTQQFFVERAKLVAVLLLVDATIPPQPADIACAEWLGEAQVCACVFVFIFPCVWRAYVCARAHVRTSRKARRLGGGAHTQSRAQKKNNTRQKKQGAVCDRVHQARRQEARRAVAGAKRRRVQAAAAGGLGGAAGVL
jgi:GTP-binding protein EngB required for normal cell division